MPNPEPPIAQRGGLVRQLFDIETTRGALTAFAFVALITAAGIIISEGLATTSERRQWVSLLQHLLITFLVVFIFHSAESLQASSRQRKESMKVKEETRESFGEIRSDIEKLLGETIPYSMTAAELGLAGVYRSRTDAMAIVKVKIHNAKQRVRMLGVAFKEGLEIGPNEAGLAEGLKRFAATRAPGKDLQILVLHPMSSPAVFRALLETSPREVREIFLFHTDAKAKSSTASGYFDTQLFTDCYQTLKNLKLHGLGSAVKYYRRDATLWMIMVDDEVFIEPYTFGRSEEQLLNDAALRLGGHMPVFHFQGLDKIPFKIVNDHFSRLWETSTDDIQSVLQQASPSTRDSYIMEHVFSPRRDWLDKVVSELERQKANRSPPLLPDLM